MGLLGRTLTLVAGTRVPIVAADRYAARTPDARVALPPTTPLVGTWPPRQLAQTGPLVGDLVVKDQIDVAGMPTGVGLADAGPPAENDATIIRRVLAAGARVIGKTKMTELGVDGLGTLMNYALLDNPAAPGHVPGGSSTGTAVAVASGLARWGIGGDGLGSIRIPSAFCGLVGLRPGRTTLPHEGLQGVVRTLDAVGPMTRTAADCVTLWQVLSDQRVEPLEPLVPARVGVPIIGGPLRVARPMWRAFQRMLAALGTDVVRVALPRLETVTFVGGMTGASEVATGRYGGRATTPAGRRSDRFGRLFGTTELARLAAQRARIQDETARALVDAGGILAMPTTAFPAPALSAALAAGRSSLVMVRALAAFTPLANLCDLPSISVPMGVDERGRPLGIMFTGTPGSEVTLLRIALAVEATGLGTVPVVL